MRRTSQGSRPDFLANADEVLLTSSQVLASAPFLERFGPF
jgi:hypothetical protein